MRLLLIFFLLFSLFALARPTNWKGLNPLLIAPLRLDSMHIKDIWIHPQSGDVFIDQTVFIELMNIFLNEDSQNNFKNIYSETNYLSINQINTTGIKLVFDPNELVLYLNIPLSMRAPNYLQIDSGDLVTGKIIGPANFSYFLNFDYQNSYKEGISDQEQIYNELNLNLKGHILNIAGYGNSQNRKRYFRDYARYIKDFEQKHIRLVLGDLSHNVVDLQQQIQGAGISIQNDFSIAPNVLRTNYNNYQIEIQRPSRVEVFINGQRLYQGQHPAGSLNLNQLPLFIGANFIKVLVTDQNGRVETFHFASQYHNNLLPTGVSDFALNLLDQSSRDSEGDLVYNKDKRFFSGYYRYGLYEQLTLGANVQAQDQNRFNGLQLSSSIGGFLTELFFTNSDYADNPKNSYLIGFQNLISNHKLRPVRFGASYRFFEKDFTYINSEKSNQKTIKSLTSSYILGSLSSLGVGIDEQVNYDNEKSEIINIEYIYRFNINSNLSLKNRIDAENSENNSIIVTYNWFEPTRSFSGFHTYNDLNHKMRNQVNYNNQFGSNRLHVAATHENKTNDSAEMATLYSNLETNYGSLRLDQTRNNNTNYNTANLRFALAGADSRPYLSPYIVNSFLIAKTNTKNDLFIGDAFAGVINNNRSFTFPSLTSYRTNMIPLNLDGLEYGENLDYDRLTVMPTFRAGSFVNIKTSKSLSLQFKITSQDPNRIKYKTLKLVHENNVLETISGKRGLVFIPNINPGRYDIYLDDQLIRNIDIEQKSGIENLGEINVD